MGDLIYIFSPPPSYFFFSPLALLVFLARPARGFFFKLRRWAVWGERDFPGGPKQPAGKTPPQQPIVDPPPHFWGLCPEDPCSVTKKKKKKTKKNLNFPTPRDAGGVWGGNAKGCTEIWHFATDRWAHLPPSFFPFPRWQKTPIAGGAFRPRGGPPGARGTNGALIFSTTPRPRGAPVFGHTKGCTGESRKVFGSTTHRLSWFWGAPPSRVGSSSPACGGHHLSPLAGDDNFF